jgi:hypothetical protein
VASEPCTYAVACPHQQRLRLQALLLLLLDSSFLPATGGVPGLANPGTCGCYYNGRQACDTRVCRGRPPPRYVPEICEIEVVGRGNMQYDMALLSEKCIVPVYIRP